MQVAFAIADGLDEDASRRKTATALDQVRKASLASAAENGAYRVRALVSRTLRFRDEDPARRAALRRAGVSARNAILPQVADIRAHEVLALEVLHARELCARELNDEDTANLAGWVARYDYERGSYAGARRLQEGVLEARWRRLGEEHPDTSITAWNLLGTLLQSEDPSAAAEVLTGDLIWLLKRDPKTLGAAQSQIREMLKTMLGRPPGG